MSWLDSSDAFIRAHTQIMALPLTPDIELHLAADARGIFQAAEGFTAGSGWRPYWAFAWPGGQSLARYIQDHPGVVAGKTVLDLGAGSGVAAIAARKAGATRAIALDPDPLAAAVVAINAHQNGAEIEIEAADGLGSVPKVDLVLIGDLVYEPELATRVTRFLETARARGTPILWADRTTAQRPPLPLVLMAEYDAPVMPLLEESHRERGRVWRLLPVGESRSVAACGT